MLNFLFANFWGPFRAIFQYATLPWDSGMDKTLIKWQSTTWLGWNSNSDVTTFQNHDMKEVESQTATCIFPPGKCPLLPPTPEQDSVPWISSMFAAWANSMQKENVTLVMDWKEEKMWNHLKPSFQIVKNIQKSTYFKGPDLPKIKILTTICIWCRNCWQVHKGCILRKIM